MSQRKNVMEFINWLDQRAEVGLLDRAIVAGIRAQAEVFLDTDARRFAERAGWTR